MSVETFTRSGASWTTYPSSAPVVLLGHGAGSMRWGRSHPLTVWALTRAPIVHSLQLPLHGENARPTLPLPISTEAEIVASVPALMIEPTFAAIAPLLLGRYVLLVAYSTSAIIFNKLFVRLHLEARLHPCSLLLTLGSALCFRSTRVGVARFWQVDAVEREPPRHRQLRKMHSPHADENDDVSWRNTWVLCGIAGGHKDSAAFLHASEISERYAQPVLTYAQRQAAAAAPVQSKPAAVCGRPYYIFHVQGSRDEPLPFTEVFVEPLRAVQQMLPPQPPGRELVAERLRLVEGATHFNMLAINSKGGFVEQFIQQMEAIIEQYGEQQLLQPWAQKTPLQQPQHAARVASKL